MYGVRQIRSRALAISLSLVAVACNSLTSAADRIPGTDSVEFELDVPGRVSLAVYDGSGRLVRTLRRGELLEAGGHTVHWDGLDELARLVPAGEYEWRLINAPGFTARYVTTIGINPPGGEHPVPRFSWVGDHVGAGIVDVDHSGVYIGSPLTEGMMMVTCADRQMTRIEWTRPQFYEGGQLRRAATSGTHVFLLHPNGKLRRLNAANGQVEADWQVTWDEIVPGDLDVRGRNLVATYPEQNTVRWLSVDDGRILADIPLPAARIVAVIGNEEQGEALVAAGREIFLVAPGRAARKVATLQGEIGAMDFDAGRNELWAVVEGHQVVRLDAADRYRVAQTYSDEPREAGPFDPTRFAGVYDIAADLEEGFYIGEPGRSPRRIAHIARDGSLIDQWFGGMSFYVNATFDPDDPTLLYGIAPEGSVNVYRIDVERGRWEIEASYETGRLGDSLFPFAASFRAVRRDGRLYLYHRVIPAVLRLDPGLRRAVPVAIAGQVINQGRTFFQFAGSGRDGFPAPWVTAADHHGYADLATAPRLYSWADSDGDGNIEPEEFRFYADAPRGISFHNPGDFASNGDYIGTTGINEPHALVRLPVAGWEGPLGDAPRWDWNRIETAGEIIADSCGYGSPRGLSVADDGSVAVAYQAGIMIREHGQYEGGGWPEAGMKGSRILGFDASLQPVFSAGRQSKNPGEASTGVLYYPMQTAPGPNGSIVVNDQTKQPAQVWTHDGLYVGAFFDSRADDGRPDGFYQVHGDDNQGVTLTTTEDGRTYWLMPYVGHNRLYEITGWEGWARQEGRIARPDDAKAASGEGTGLTAVYSKGGSVVFETTEAPIYHEPFGGEPHADRITPGYEVVWSGFVEPPLSDRYRFHSLLGAGERLEVWIDDQLVHSAGTGADVDESFELAAGHRRLIRIEYANPDGRAELKLLWSSRVLDPSRLSEPLLFPHQE